MNIFRKRKGLIERIEYAKQVRISSYISGDYEKYIEASLTLRILENKLFSNISLNEK